MPARDLAQVGLPGRARGQVHDQRSLGREREDRVGFTAAQPAVVLLEYVVGEANEVVALGELTQALGARGRVVGRAPRAVVVGDHRESPGVALARKRHVIQVVRVVVDRRTHDRRELGDQVIRRAGCTG